MCHFIRPTGFTILAPLPVLQSCHICATTGISVLPILPFLSALQVLPSPSFRHLVSRRIAQCINGPINQCVSKRTDQSMYESLVESVGESPNGRRYEWRRLVSHTSHFLHFGALTGITVLPFSGGSRGFYRSSASKQAARQIREFKNGPLDISIVESAQEPANDSSANLRLS